MEEGVMSTDDRAFAVHEVYPYLRVRDAARALDFYKRAFGAEELFRLTEPSGRIGHAEIKIGGTTLMLADEYPEMNIVGPQTLGGTSFSIHLHVDSADAWIERAVAAGAIVLRPAADAFYGERSGSVRDPFGHEWLLGHQIEEVSTQEMQRRYTALFEG
jgi:PhnB protein